MMAERAAGGRRGRKRRKKTAWRAARTEFRGVQQRESGKYGAQIRDSKSKGRPKVWLGSFHTAEEAARAFDAAAVRLRGAAAVTNFKRPSADDEGVCPLLHAPAEPSGQDTGSAARTTVRKKKAAAAAATATATQPEGGTLRRAVSTTSAADDEGLALDRRSSRVKKRAAAAARQSEALVAFRGVHPTASGKYGARIRVRRSGVNSRVWLGTFNTAEEAARAYDPAVVEMDGASAVTNFQQSAAKDSVSCQPCGRSAAKTNLKQPPTAMAADYSEEWCTDLLIDFLELSELDFCSDNIIPGAQHGDLKSDLRPAETEWRQVDEFLKDMESIDDRDALVEAAAILQQISLAGMEMVGEPSQHKR